MMNSSLKRVLVCATLVFSTGAFAAGSCGNPAAIKRSTSASLNTPSAIGSVAPVQTTASAPKPSSDTTESSSSSASSALEASTSKTSAPSPIVEANDPSSQTTSRRSDLSQELKAAVKNFEMRYPKTKVTAFALTPFVGLFEASVGKEVVYFDQSARFLVSGRLLDMEAGSDLTDKRLKDLRRIDFKALPLEKAVKTVYGNGKKRLALFTDVDCPFSRKLAATMKDLKDTTVYTFLFPLQSLHPQAKSKSDAVWCAKDASLALDKALQGEAISASIKNHPLCDSVVDDVLKLASELGVAGTPTLINEAGDRISGALPLEQLQSFVDARA